MPLSGFHPIVQRWFLERFEAATPAQERGWPAIAQGHHTLIAAPTGSGKTLAAFLTCIDRLVRAGLEGRLPDRTEVVYVSPLRALANDVERNLTEPLAEIRELAEAVGTPLPEIRVAVRTGDTPQRDRQAMTRRPPHILITTPESLYILLTSESGRRGLRGARTLIVDEVHAIVGNKRGSHLSLSMERLRALADGPVTRIGLSATQRPIEEVARFLVGADDDEADGSEDPRGDAAAPCGDAPLADAAESLRGGAPPAQIVDVGHARDMDLALEMSDDELGPIASHELWARTLDRVAELVAAHRSTLVFVNTRRLAERVAHLLSLRLGQEAVVAHHGSLSRERRLAAERRLKDGGARVCVATASLELGIDIGAVDLVCQIGSPRSIGLLLQRVGRSGHSLGATPKGRLFPLTRDELMECIALLRGAWSGNLDRYVMPPWPLDVLAQQIVAMCAAEEWGEDELYGLCRRAHPYRDLPRDRFDQVLDCSRPARPRARAAAPPCCTATGSTEDSSRAAGLASRPSPAAARSRTTPTTMSSPSRRGRSSARCSKTLPSRAWPATSSFLATRRGRSAGSRAVACGSKPPTALPLPSRSGSARPRGGPRSCLTRSPSFARRWAGASIRVTAWSG